MLPLHPLRTDIARPQCFTYPFNYQPHPLCRLAAEAVQQYVGSHEEIRRDADNGKMFGVLVCDSPCGGLSFLAAYSGLLAGRNDWEFFVPPVYDAQQPDGYFKTTERQISAISGSQPLVAKKMSQELQQWLFRQYRLLNARGEERDLVQLWQQYYDRPKLLQRYPLPPGGTGDCCAPKLLQYAFRQHLRPLCMAEFWWGRATKTEVRQHLNFYPACRGKCLPILTWMLQGLDVDADPEQQALQQVEIPVVYEDQWLLVVDKPSGVLAVPGRTQHYSVETALQQRCPGCRVAHRLDMATSGLLIVAKSLEVYQALQQQFVRHEVRKQYLAVLESPQPGQPVSDLPPAENAGGTVVYPKRGTISLPLRPDPMNRPRQVVDREHGKRAVTDYEFVGDSLIALYPQTGRTHQLRMHCAHPEGLGRPIVGDALYGTPGGRLMLHASELSFRHPATGAALHLTSQPPFL